MSRFVRVVKKTFWIRRVFSLSNFVWQIVQMVFSEIGVTYWGPVCKGILLFGLFWGPLISQTPINEFGSWIL